MSGLFAPVNPLRDIDRTLGVGDGPCCARMPSASPVSHRPPEQGGRPNRGP